MYITITNGNPEIYTIGQLRRDNPNISFPKTISDDILTRYNVYPYTQLDIPNYDEKTETIVDGGFLQDENGNWSKTWKIQSKSQEEIDAWLAAKETEVRNKRNQLLAETDFYALTDVTMAPEMATYRQALRDITTQIGFPETIEWPVKPI